MNLQLKKILLNPEVSNRIACAHFCLYEDGKVIFNLYINVTLNVPKYQKGDSLEVSIKGPQVKLIDKELEDRIFDATYVALNSGTIGESTDNTFIKLCKLYKELFVSCFEKGRFDNIDMETLRGVEIGYMLLDRKDAKSKACENLQTIANRALSESVITAELREVAFSVN